MPFSQRYRETAVIFINIPTANLCTDTFVDLYIK